MVRGYLKGLLLGTIVVLGCNVVSVQAEPRAIDYSVTVNSDFTDGLNVVAAHMCGECREANDLSEILDSGVSYYHKIRIDKIVKEQLPEALLDSFRYSGHRLYLTSRDIREFVGYSSGFEPAGVYTSITKSIYLSNKYNNYWAEYAVLHEFGHYLDFAVWSASNLKGRASKTSEFTDIWLEERSNLKLDAEDDLVYFQSTVTEYFAQAFKEYVDNPTRLKANTPKTYAYIDKCLKIIELSVVKPRNY